MKILAIDTSSLTASVAVGEDGAVLGEFMTNYKKTHSERIMPMVSSLLDSLDIDICDIDAYAAAIGPGSFTGLRIGIATVKAFAQVNNKPVVTAKTTEMLAYNISDTDKLICPIMDARAGQVYNGIYEYQNGAIATMVEARAIKLEDLIKELNEHDKEILFLGDGAAVYQDALISELKDKAVFAPEHLKMQRASALISVGFARLRQGDLNSFNEVVPFYLRKPQAERERELKLKNKTSI